jgi:hypothetical protein
MGADLKCRARFDGKTSEGRALLETSEIIFRGDFRLKIPFKEMKKVSAANGELRVRFADGEAVFELRAAATKWMDKILHPKSLIEKLGVRPGQKITVLNVSDEDFLRDAAKTAEITNKLVKKCELIFFGAQSRAELKRVAALTKSLAPAGALWIVYPKGQKAITEMDVICGGRKAQLKDVKVASFSATHTALKFVIPLERREKS